MDLVVFARKLRITFLYFVPLRFSHEKGARDCEGSSYVPESGNHSGFLLALILLSFSQSCSTKDGNQNRRDNPLFIVFLSAFIAF